MPAYLQVECPKFQSVLPIASWMVIWPYYSHTILGNLSWCSLHGCCVDRWPQTLTDDYKKTEKKALSLHIKKILNICLQTVPVVAQNLQK